MMQHLAHVPGIAVDLTRGSSFLSTEEGQDESKIVARNPHSGRAQQVVCRQYSFDFRQHALDDDVVDQTQQLACSGID